MLITPRQMDGGLIGEWVCQYLVQVKKLAIAVRCAKQFEFRSELGSESVVALAQVVRREARAKTPDFRVRIQKSVFGHDCRVAEKLAQRTSAHAYTTAYRENEILERYFAVTLQQSTFRWSDPEKQAFAQKNDPRTRFESTVGKHLFTVITEKTVVLMTAFLLAALIALDLVTWRANARQQ